MLRLMKFPTTLGPSSFPHRINPSSSVICSKCSGFSDQLFFFSGINPTSHRVIVFGSSRM